MYETLSIIKWPDPRLLQLSKPVETFDASLEELVQRMLELMREQRGVGLAAPQVGINWRLFVMNPTGQPEHDRVYVNPTLSQPDGQEEGEEGCLSLPGLNVKVVRSRGLRMSAKDASGRPIEEQADGYIARIWQHEYDHLDGILLVDRMSALAKLGARKLLKDLRSEFEAEHPSSKRKAARV